MTSDPFVRRRVMESSVKIGGTRGQEWETEPMAVSLRLEVLGLRDERKEVGCSQAKISVVRWISHALYTNLYAVSLWSHRNVGIMARGRIHAKQSKG